jgi:hypothetical protein
MSPPQDGVPPADGPPDRPARRFRADPRDARISALERQVASMQPGKIARARAAVRRFFWRRAVPLAAALTLGYQGGSRLYDWMHPPSEGVGPDGRRLFSSAADGETGASQLAANRELAESNQTELAGLITQMGRAHGNPAELQRLRERLIDPILARREGLLTAIGQGVTPVPGAEGEFRRSLQEAIRLRNGQRIQELYTDAYRNRGISSRVLREGILSLSTVLAPSTSALRFGG